MTSCDPKELQIKGDITPRKRPHSQLRHVERMIDFAVDSRAKFKKSTEIAMILVEYMNIFKEFNSF